MQRRLVIDGNEVYEIDEECMLKKQEEEARRQEQKASAQKRSRDGNAPDQSEKEG